MNKKIKDENLDLYISEPITGKHLWVRTINPEIYPYLDSYGYEWLFEDVDVSIAEDDFFNEKDDEDDDVPIL